MREGGAELRQQPPPRCRQRATCTRAAAGESEEQRASSGAGAREGNRARSPAARPGPAARRGPPAAAPTAGQPSVRLLLQLPAVQGLRGKTAWRREGRGGTKAARSQPWEVGRKRGCSEPSTSTLRHPPVQGAPARRVAGESGG